MNFKVGDLVRIPYRETIHNDTLQGFRYKILVENMPHKVIDVSTPGHITVQFIGHQAFDGWWTLGSEYVTLWKDKESRLPMWF
jgi:hypothetical protein